MPFLLILLLLLISLHEVWPNPLELGPDRSCWYTFLGVGVLALAAEFGHRIVFWALRRQPSDRGPIMRACGRIRRWHVIGLIGFFFASLYGLGWGHAVEQVGTELGIPGFRLILLAPLLAGLAISWLRQYDVDRLNSEILHYPYLASFPSRAAYFGLQARHHLLFLLPPVVLLLAHEGVFAAAPSLHETENSYLTAAIGIGLLAAMLIGMPIFLRLFLGLRPLPAGPLRDRLKAKACALKFGFTDVLVWNTQRGVANAMVTGVLGWLRYVVLTDRLVEELSDEEIEAVFGHEVGHMKHHHMAFYMVFFAASFMLLSGFCKACNHWFKNMEPPTWLGPMGSHAGWSTVAVWIVGAVVVAYVLIVFGWLSRRCERQADIFGSKTASPAAFISALEKVADVNGMPRERPGFLSWWQHSTIADRVTFIRQMEADPAIEPVFQRRLRWTKWGLSAALVGLVAVLRFWWEWDVMKLF